MKIAGSKFILTITGLVLALTTSVVLAKPRLQMGPDAEITYDGLHRVDKTVMDAAWVKPDLDLRPYTQIMFVGAGISYKAVDNEGRRYVPGRSNDTEFGISDEGKQRFEREVREVFTARLAELERYEIVTEPGPGVLLLVGAILDVVSNVPPVGSCTGRCEIYLNSVGEATLVIELRDSVTNEVLLRAADRRAAQSAGWAINANSVTVWAEVRRLAGFWAQRLRKGLDDFESIDDLN